MQKKYLRVWTREKKILQITIYSGNWISPTQTAKIEND